MDSFTKRERSGGARALPRLAAASACAVATCASATNIWVVTDREHPVTHADSARVIELDAPASFETALSRHLPSDPKRAAVIVRQRLEAGGSALQHRLTAAYQGVTDAWSLGITRVPAVIVDGRYVVYGVPDVDRAIALIEMYRKTHR
jgi:integrating conjugative element protein (TIGR03757 family)